MLSRKQQQQQEQQLQRQGTAATLDALALDRQQAAALEAEAAALREARRRPHIGIPPGVVSIHKISGMPTLFGESDDS